jgi:hypothetical protein
MWVFEPLHPAPIRRYSTAAQAFRIALELRLNGHLPEEQNKRERSKTKGFPKFARQ